MRKFAILGVAAAAMALGATSAGASDPIDLEPAGYGCVSSPGDTCSFDDVPRTGGYAAGGDNWSLTVEVDAQGDARDTNNDGQLRYVFTPANAPEAGCGLFGAGADITTSAGDGSGIAAGTPVPSPAADAIGDGNDCDSGLIAADNPNYTPVD